MNRKLQRYVIIGMLLFDLCLIAVRSGSMSDQGQFAVPWTQGLQNVPEVSFDPGSARTQTTEKLTVTTVFLLTAITLM